MKKIIVLFILMLILTPISTKAESEGLYTPQCLDGYLKVESGDYNAIKQVCLLKRKSDNKYMYNLDFWLMDNSALVTNSSEYDEIKFNKLTSDIYRKIERYASFGYSYFGNTIDWYIVTQYLLWDTYKKDYNIYFVDYKTGNRVDKYDDMIEKIKSFVDKQLQKPSIINKKYELKDGEVLLLEDETEVLNNYEIISDNQGVEIVKKNNKIEIKGLSSGIEKIVFREPIIKNRNQSTLIYYDKFNQLFLSYGDITRLEYELEIEVIENEKEIYDNQDVIHEDNNENKNKSIDQEENEEELTNENENILDKTSIKSDDDKTIDIPNTSTKSLSINKLLLVISILVIIIPRKSIYEK